MNLNNFNSLILNYKETFDLFDESTILFNEDESLFNLKYIEICYFMI